jgi:hypothetical protein
MTKVKTRKNIDISSIINDGTQIAETSIETANASG